MRVGARVVDVMWVKQKRSMSLISSLVLISRAQTFEFSSVILAAVEGFQRSKKSGEVVMICECVPENSVGREAIKMEIFWLGNIEVIP